MDGLLIPVVVSAGADSTVRVSDAETANPVGDGPCRARREAQSNAARAGITNIPKIKSRPAQLEY